MSAGGDVAKAANIAALPIWNFHGTIDATVLVKESRDMIAAIQAAGGTPKYTEYPNGGHAIWDQAYTEPDLLPWMFGTQAATIEVDGGLLDAAAVLDAGPGATGNDSGAVNVVDAASPVEAAVAPSGGDGGVVASNDDSGASGVPPADDQAGCSCRMTETRSTGRWGDALLIAIGLSMKRRRRTASAFSAGAARVE